MAVPKFILKTRKSCIKVLKLLTSRSSPATTGKRKTTFRNKIVPSSSNETSPPSDHNPSTDSLTIDTNTTIERTPLLAGTEEDHCGQMISIFSTFDQRCSFEEQVDILEKIRFQNRNEGSVFKYISALSTAKRFDIVNPCFDGLERCVLQRCSLIEEGRLQIDDHRSIENLDNSWNEALEETGIKNLRIRSYF